MIGGNEAHARVLINERLKDQGWDIQDPNAVRYEFPLKGGSFADYVLCDRHGRSLAVIGRGKTSRCQSQKRISSPFDRKMNGTPSCCAYFLA